MEFKLSIFQDVDKVPIRLSEPAREMGIYSDEIFRFEGNIEFEGRAEKVNEKILVVGKLKVPVNAVCSRCFDDFTMIIEHDFVFLYIKKTQANREIDESQEAYYHTDTIKLDNEIRDLIILNLPSKTLCSSSCRGMCKFCGMNLNRGTCDCEQEHHDPGKPDEENTVNLGELIKKQLKGG